MQTAKSNGRHGIQYFTDSLNLNYLEKIELEAHLREALAEDKLEVNFQAFVQPENSEVKGYYASLQWQHPDKGLIDAAELLDGLDQVKLQTRLIYKILKQGCSQFVSWRLLDPARSDFILAIPFPAFHMINNNFVSNLKNALQNSGMDPKQLTLEISETNYDFSLVEFKQLIKEIAELGVKLSLNLFSSPKTPLTHLFQLDLDTIRVDISTIDNILDNPKSAIFFKSIVSMAHDLGVEVIADKVAIDKEATLVKSLGADALMGEFVGSPLPISELLNR